LRYLNEARVRLGLAPLDVPHQQIERADRVLILASRTFDLPARSLPDNVRYVGTMLAAAPASEWEPPPDDGRPLVLVSLSTLPQGQGPIMQRILEALHGLPVRAVVTLGRSLAGDSFDPPANAQLETVVPHEVVLPHVAAVVTQCGFSTITKSLAHGVPLVAIPVLGDQPANAARIMTLGVGIRLRRDAAAPAIADAIHRVIDQATYRQAAQRFSVTLATEDPRAAVIDELEDLARGH
jgi:MGT family glycosyltransferase